MDDEITGHFRRTSSRNRKVASKMVAALTSSDNRSQAAIARLEALENDNAGAEMVEINDDSDASLDDDEEKTVQEYKAENQAGESARECEEGPKNVHGAVTRSKSRSLASTRAILSEGCCGPPKLNLTSLFLHRLWVHCQLHMREVRDAVLLMPLPGHTHRHSMFEIRRMTQVLLSWFAV